MSHFTQQTSQKYITFHTTKRLKGHIVWGDTRAAYNRMDKAFFIHKSLASYVQEIVR